MSQPEAGPLRVLGAALSIGLALSACAPAPIRIPTAPIDLGEGAAEHPAAPQGGPELPSINGPALRVLLRRGSQGLKVAAPGGLVLCGMQGAILARLPSYGKAGLSAM